MAFVNELIPEADKARIDWSQFKAWSFSRPPHTSTWTIDRSRDVFFVALEGRGRESERPETYALYWKGAVIRIEALTAHKGTFDAGVYAHWKILKIEMPHDLQSIRQEITDVMREAIDVYGVGQKRETVKSVEIEFA